MNVKLRVISMAAVFFTGSLLMAQKTPISKSDSTKIEEIDEVIIVGYQSKKKKDLTTSVGIVEAKDMNDIPITTFDQLLAGKSPGVDLQIGSGQPGASASIVIRGAGTINGGTTPLYIVDGVPVAAGAFASLNPNDIETVSILKDAAAKSIYGSQAGAGVILVTTKQGKKGSMRISYVGSAGISTRPQAKFNMMSTAELTKIQLERGFINQATFDARNLINTKWDDVFFRNGYTTSNDLSVSGGEKNTTYRVSLGHLDQDGIAINSGLQRVTSNISLQTGNGKNFRMGFTGIFGLSKRNNVASEAAVNLTNPYAAAYLSLPYQTLYNADGSYATGSGRYGANAYELAQTSERKRQEIKATSGLFAEYDFNEHFTAKVTGNVDYLGIFQKNFTDPLSFQGKSVSPGKSGNLARSYGQFTTLNSNAMLSYKNDWGLHNLNVFGLAEYTGKFYDGFSYTGYGLEPLLGNVPSSVKVTKDILPVIGGSERSAAVLSYLGNVDYNYDSKYFVAANFRRDGGSLFSNGNKWGNFGGVSVGWAINRESFMSGTAFNDLKLRASWGVLGNTGDLFDVNLYNQESTVTNGQYDGNTTLGRTGPFNADYSWEKEEQTNIGLDFGLWNNRLSGSFDVYDKRTYDLYIDKSLSRTSGFNELDNYNGGEMSNKGVEVSLSYDIIRTKDTKLNIFGNFAYNKNEILSLGEVNEYELGTAIVRVGLPFGSHYAVKWGGVDPTNGSPIYLDENDQRMPAFDGSKSQATFGSYYAPYQGGFGLSLSHKGFFVDGQFQWKAEYYRFNNMRFFNENAANINNYNQYQVVSTYWKEPGQVTDIQSPNYALQFTSKFIEDSSFLRLRNVRVGYNFNSDLLTGTGLKEVGFFLNATNLFTWTDWTGVDPDDSNNLSSYEYPSPRILSIGAKLTF